MADWIVVPVLDCWDYTEPALKDCLTQQGVSPQVLVINQGSSDETRGHLENWAAQEPRLHIVTHDPPMPSLGATWNAALETIWWMEREASDPAVLMMNNDVRLHPLTYQVLKSVRERTDGWLVSAVGVKEAQFEQLMSLQTLDEIHQVVWDVPGECLTKGGPDFSCYLITKPCHKKYSFDEVFKPCYCEDVSYHRRMMLGGDGSRIFGVDLPFLHYASRTINRSPEALRAFHPKYDQCVEVYKEMWGGKPNEEQWTRPCDPTSAAEGVTTPELHRKVLAADDGQA